MILVVIAMRAVAANEKQIRKTVKALPDFVEALIRCAVIARIGFRHAYYYGVDCINLICKCDLRHLAFNARQFLEPGLVHGLRIQ